MHCANSTIKNSTIRENRPTIAHYFSQYALLHNAITKYGTSTRLQLCIARPSAGPCLIQTYRTAAVQTDAHDCHYTVGAFFLSVQIVFFVATPFVNYRLAFHSAYRSLCHYHHHHDHHAICSSKVLENINCHTIKSFITYAIQHINPKKEEHMSAQKCPVSWEICTPS